VQIWVLVLQLADIQRYLRREESELLS